MKGKATINSKIIWEPSKGELLSMRSNFLKAVKKQKNNPVYSLGNRSIRYSDGSIFNPSLGVWIKRTPNLKKAMEELRQQISLVNSAFKKNRKGEKKYTYKDFRK